MSNVDRSASLPEPSPEAGGQVPRDVALFRQARSGDRAAYGQIVTSYQDRVFNAVLRMVGNRDEARELTQETFTRGLDKIAGFRGDSAPYTWLFRIAMNLAIGQLRKMHRRRVFSLSAGSGGDGDQASGLMDHVSCDPGERPEQAVERQERQEMVLAALGRLDAEYRAVLIMRDVEDMDYRQMAQVLDLPMGTLKSRLFRARLALRDELKAYTQPREV